MNLVEIADRIESVLPKKRPIEHHDPFISPKKASEEIFRRLEKGIQNYRPIDLFEDWITEITGAKYALATNSGTAAIHLALLSLGIKTLEQVIVPANTFVATDNPVSYIGGVSRFIDGAPNADPEYLRYFLNRNKDIYAMIVVHLFGIPANIKEIREITDEFNVYLIEDACQALGTTLEGKHVGTFGKVGILSFNNNKILTTNGGGALITDDKDVYEKARKLSIMGRIPHKYLIEYEGVGWNYRMNSINAALGLSQTHYFGEILEKKRNLAQKYRESLGNLVEFVEPSIECTQNYWLTPILVDNRDELLDELHRRGIKARASFVPLAKLPTSEEFYRRCVCLPSGKSACNENTSSIRKQS